MILKKNKNKNIKNGRQENLKKDEPTRENIQFGSLTVKM